MKDSARAAISRAVRTAGYEGWSWKERDRRIIRCQKENGIWEDFAVIFEPDGSLRCLERESDGKEIAASFGRELSEEAFFSYYEGVLTGSLGYLQELAGEIAEDGPRWIECAEHNGGKVPKRNELRALAKAFEELGFQILGLRFSDGAIRLGITESRKRK